MIRLHPTISADLDFVLAAERDPENLPFIGQWTRQEHWAALGNPDLAHLLLERASDSQPVGYALLTGLQGVDQCILLKRLVVTIKAKGYGRAALGALKELVFVQLQAHRFWLDVKEHNLRARHLYKTEGFVEEGVLRECLKTGAGFESLVVMSLLREEFDRLTRTQLGGYPPC
ncbi:GNAT family N-acetyltransferase [Anthocerotibacter panamensis]|uniref:GNAT family N-acetyltransferase n=1 Tax=Anthocerotibacter panamensis TaxID=2857077 RepID=UPI001C4033F0|nr:GNAT family protein [Anthocerotibacter panamensis]